MKIVPFSRVIFLIALLSIVALRLAVWKIFPDMEFSIKDDFSNMLISGMIFLLAAFFYGVRFIRRERWVKSGLEGPLALFILVAAASMAWTPDLSATASALVILLAYVLFFQMLFELLLEVQLRRVFFWAFLVASAVVALIGINDIIYLNSVSAQDIELARVTNESLYYILIHKRACSLFGWPNVLAGFLMLGMPLAGGLFFVVKHWAWKAVYLLAALLMLAAFFLTFSFLGWSVFLFTSLVMSVLLWRSGMLKVSPLMGRWVLAAGFLFMALFAIVVVKKNFRSSMTPRKEYVRVVTSVIAQHPLRGSGWGAYRAASFKYVDNREGMTGFAHNAYLQIWAESGLPGFLALIWLVFLLGRMSLRALNSSMPQAQRVMLIVVLWGMAAFLIDNLNSFTMLKPNSSFFFWTWLAVACSVVHLPEDRQNMARRHDRWLMGLMVAACVVGIFMTARCAGYLQGLQRAVQLINAGQSQAGRAVLWRAQPLNPLDVRVWTTMGTSYVREFQSGQNRVAVEKARRAFEQAAKVAPEFYYSYLILSRIYAFYGDRAQALALQQKAMALSPFETRRDLFLLQGGQR